MGNGRSPTNLMQGWLWNSRLYCIELKRISIQALSNSVKVTTIVCGKTHTSSIFGTDSLRFTIANIHHAVLANSGCNSSLSWIDSMLYTLLHRATGLRPGLLVAHNRINEGVSRYRSSIVTIAQCVGSSLHGTVVNVGLWRANFLCPVCSWWLTTYLVSNPSATRSAN